ncbi:MAG: hypothetical protein HQK54_02545 [Oligoflexales bacterium]|nr:hypothetical protein [Oligoflexales bacterium]
MFGICLKFLVKVIVIIVMAFYSFEAGGIINGGDLIYKGRNIEQVWINSKVAERADNDIQARRMRSMLAKHKLNIEDILKKQTNKIRGGKEE